MKGQSKNKKLELENKVLRDKLKMAEKRIQWHIEYLEDEKPFLIAVDKLVSILTPFIPQSHKSQKLYTKADQEAIRSGKTDEERQAIAVRIFKRIGQSAEAKDDKKINEAFWKKWNTTPQTEQINYLLKILPAEINRYRKYFDQNLKYKPRDSKEVLSKKPTPLEKKLYKFCAKNRINLKWSIDRIHYEASERGFKNLKGKSILNRSTVGKMIQKYRP